jgi:hypothetical protein
VTKATSREAVEDNFGGDTTADGVNNATACMLQYVCKDLFDDFMAELRKVPAERTLLFLEEEAGLRLEAARKRDAHLHMFVKVFDEADVAAHVHFDLVDVERVRPDCVLRVEKMMTVGEFKAELLTQRYRVENPDMIRLHICSSRRNLTVRASKLVRSDETAMVALLSKKHLDDLMLLVEISARSAAPSFDTSVENECRIFFKFYDPLAKELKYVTRLYIDKSATLRAVEPQLRQLARVAADAPLLYFEEVRHDTLFVELVDPAQTVGNLELGNGDILVFQTVVDVAASDMPTVPIYFRFLKESVSVKFKRLVIDAQEDSGFSIMCRKFSTYEQVQDVVVTHLAKDVCDDPRKIQLLGRSTAAFGPAWVWPFLAGREGMLEKMLRGGAELAL